ncbi:MAG: hypothetical protein J6B67_02345 [Oscillospiraceae bacterium]|nr:hypothetical protein [Oscillospiraceae bacterium]
MDKKVKLGLTASGIVSIVFGSLGIIYLLLGTGLHFFPTEEDDPTAGTVFAVLGAAFVLSAVIIFLCMLANRKCLQRIVNAGRYIWGEIVDIVPNYNVRINGRNSYVVLVRYADSRGTTHIFRSRDQKTYPDRSIVGKQVKVYYETEDFKRYYVDLDGALPRVIEH